MSVTVKQMSLESGFERTQQLKIPDVWWQLVAQHRICKKPEFLTLHARM